MGCRTSVLTVARRGPVTSFVDAHLLGYSGSKCRLRSSHPAGHNESDNLAPSRPSFGIGCGRAAARHKHFAGSVGLAYEAEVGSLGAAGIGR